MAERDLRSELDALDEPAAQPDFSSSPLVKQLEQDGTIEALTMRQRIQNDADRIEALTKSRDHMGIAGSSVGIMPESDPSEASYLEQVGHALLGTARTKKEWAEREVGDIATARDRVRQVEDTTKRGAAALSRMFGAGVGETIAGVNVGLTGVEPVKRAETPEGRGEKAIAQREQNLRRIQSGEDRAPMKTGLRSGLENVATGAIEALPAAIAKTVGIGWGYGARVMGSEAPPDENLAYAVGNWISAKGKELFPGDFRRQEEFSQKLAQGAGSMIGFMGPGVAAKLMSASDATLIRLTMISGAGAEGVETFEDASRSMKERPGEVPEWKRFAAWVAGLGLGTTEALPIASMLRRRGGSFTGAIAREAGEEGIQEFGQSIGEDVTAKMLHDPNRQIGENALEAAAIGGILGAGMQGGRLAVSRRAREEIRSEQQPAAPAQPAAQPAPEITTTPDLAAMAERPRAPGETPARVPTFNDALAVLPKDAAGDPDVMQLTTAIQDLGKASWNALDAAEKAQVLDKFRARPADAAMPAETIPPDIADLVRQAAPDVAAKHGLAAAGGQTSFLAEPTTQDRIRAAEAEKRKRPEQRGMDEGLFGSSAQQVDLEDAIRAATVSGEQQDAETVGKQPQDAPTSVNVRQDMEQLRTSLAAVNRKAKLAAMAEEMGLGLSDAQLSGKLADIRATILRAAESKAAAGERQTAARRSVRREAKPASIVDFVRARGGINDVGGALRAMDAQRRPGLMNKLGLDPDRMRELAVEAGYLAESAAGDQAVTTADDLIEAIREDLAGRRVYSAVDAERAAALKDAEIATGQLEQLAVYEQEMVQWHEALDVPFAMSQVEIERAAVLLAAGVDIDTAIEQVQIQTINELADEAQQGTASGDGRRAAEAGGDIPFVDGEAAAGDAGAAVGSAGEARETGGVAAQFRDILRGTTSAKTWARQLGVTDAELQPFVDEAVRAGLLRVAKGGMIRRTPKAKQGSETNAPDRNQGVERDWRDGPPQDGLGEADVPVIVGTDAGGPLGRGDRPDGGGVRADGGGGLPAGDAAAAGAGSDSDVQGGAPGDGGGAAERGGGGRGGDAGEPGVSPERIAEDAVATATPAASPLAQAIEAQARADTSVRFVANDPANIRAALPLLKPAQQDDVIKAEARLTRPDGHGFLFTNGTGTGKTFTGLGVIKRFVAQGKSSVLIVAPSQGILDGWVASGRMIGLDITRLPDTGTAGSGIVATTYANLRSNAALAYRSWDLLVADEAHHLSQNAVGNPSDALQVFRGLSGRTPWQKARLKLTAESNELLRLKEEAKTSEAAREEHKAKSEEYHAKLTALTEEFAKEPRAKALFLSATPFAYRKNTDWGDGFLFDYPPEKNGYNNRGGQAEFLVTNFGYNMRYGRAEEPGPEVNVGVLEREFYERLKREGVLAGRRLEVEADYDRRFVLVDDAVGAKIDQAMDWLNTEQNGRYRPLADAFREKFDYLAQRRLLEAIKARHVIPRIKKDLALGRKVVVFHDYNEGGGINAFDMPDNPNERVRAPYGEVGPTIGELYGEFIKANPYVTKLNFAQFTSPITTLTRAFPQAMVYNGRVPNKQRAAARDEFNRDGSGRDIIIVQSAAGEAGISLHDTTGKHQRVLYNLGLPTRPTTAIQQEGRIYREGQVSDAILRYMSTGTGWERKAFAQTIAERASTAENLALGDEARALRDAFINAFNDADAIDQGSAEGKGGKAADRAAASTVTQFEKAKAFYFGEGKKKGRRDQREGKDYYATPEPIGLKMVEFADIEFGEKALEPSAGHGAISRWFPEGADRTVIEPSPTLASRASLSAPGAKVIESTFENHYIGNKYDAIVMNPPFGVGGKDAIDHLQKATQHLRMGGRVVAVIPRGGAADSRFDKMMEAPENKQIYLAGDIAMPPVMFERAGTKVATRIVVLERHADPANAPQQVTRDLSDAETIGQLFDRIEGLSFRKRRRGDQVAPKVAKPAAEAMTSGTERGAGAVEAAGVTAKIQAAAAAGTAAFAAGKPAVPALDKNVLGLLADTRVGDGNAVLDAWIGAWHAANAAAPTEAAAEPALAPEMEQTPAPAPEAEIIGGTRFKAGEAVHGKTGEKLFVASMADFVPRETYDKLRGIAKKYGGYYSTFRGRGAIPGFQFRSEESRKAFVDDARLATGGRRDGASRGGARDNGQPMFALGALRSGAKLIDEIGPNDPHPGKVIAYHGTGARFIEDGGKFDVERSADFAMHFGTREQANRRLGFESPVFYGLANGERVIPVVLDLDNVVTLPDMQSWPVRETALEIEQRVPALAGLTADIDASNITNRADGDDIIRQRLTAAGIDGIRYQNSVEGEGWSYMVWEPGKVRSALSSTELMRLTGEAPQFSQEARARRKEITDGIAAEIKKMLPANVAIRLADRVTKAIGDGLTAEGFGAVTPQSDGRFLLEVALRYGSDKALSVGRHETVHVLREMGLFENAEWRLLLEEAERQGIGASVSLVDGMDAAAANEQYRMLYRANGVSERLSGKALDDYVNEYLDQEKVARLAEMWSTGQQKASTKAAALLDRIKALLEAIVNAMRGLGLQNVNDVFERVLSGGVAARARVAPQLDQLPPGVHALGASVPPVPGFLLPGLAGTIFEGPMSHQAMMAIRAYHGSPHDFDRFDISKIGTGEGAQAYGLGLYFAESEGVAKTYRDAGSASQGKISYRGVPVGDADLIAGTVPGAIVERMGSKSVDARTAVAQERSFIEQDLARLEREASRQDMGSYDQAAERTRQDIVRLQARLREVHTIDPADFSNSGRLYEVRINENPDHFLDWDKPLSQQSEHVRGLFTTGRLAEAERYAAENYRPDAWARGVGESLSGHTSDGFGPRASAALREAGIPGIKYLDRGSRAAGDGTRNYVVFDDSLIEIVAKDGKPVSREVRDAIREAAAGENGRAMMSFAGVLAQTADHDALAQAKRMEGDGRTRDDIWAETGWFRGVDGKWRFEIDDSQSGWHWMSGASERFESAGSLAAAYDHQRLFKAYPPLSVMAVGTEAGGAGGTYLGAQSGGPRIDVATMETADGKPWRVSDEYLRSKLMHEVQHGVQDIEQFARGGSLRMFSPDEIAAERASIMAANQGDGWTSIETAAGDMADTEVARRLYSRLAGEVEARSVQKRMDYTTEQRRSRPPWLDYDVPEDQQIVRVRSGGPMMSFAGPFGARNMAPQPVIQRVEAVAKKESLPPPKSWRDWFRRSPSSPAAAPDVVRVDVRTGRNVKGPEEIMLATATAMRDGGASADDIFRITGAVQIPGTRDFGFEIDDSAATWLPGTFKATYFSDSEYATQSLRETSIMPSDRAKGAKIRYGTSAKAPGAMAFSGRLGDMFAHPKLFEAYPFLPEMTVTVVYGPSLPDRLDGTGVFSPKRVMRNGKPYDVLSIIVRGRTPDVAKRTLLHEIQHYIARKEKWPPGAMPGAIDPRRYDKHNWSGDEKQRVETTRGEDALADYWKRRDAMQLDAGSPGELRLRDDLMASLRIDHKDYAGDAGEVLAERAAQRMSLSADERKRNAPFSASDMEAEDRGSRLLPPTGGGIRKAFQIIADDLGKTLGYMKRLAQPQKFGNGTITAHLEPGFLQTGHAAEITVDGAKVSARIEFRYDSDAHVTFQDDPTPAGAVAMLKAADAWARKRNRTASISTIRLPLDAAKAVWEWDASFGLDDLRRHADKIEGWVKRNVDPDARLDVGNGYGEDWAAIDKGGQRRHITSDPYETSDIDLEKVMDDLGLRLEATIAGLDQKVADIAASRPRGPMMSLASGDSPAVMFALAPSEPPKIKALSDIIADLKDALGMPATQGRTMVTAIEPSTGRKWSWRPRRNVRAQYDSAGAIARVKTVTDIESFAHEAGHHIERLFAGRGGSPLDKLKQDHADDLVGFTGSVATTPENELSEGFAEFFKAYVLEPDKARTQAPRLVEAFDDLLDGETPAVLDLLDRARLITASAEYQRYDKASSLDRATADLASNADHSWSRRLQDFYDKIGQGNTISGWMHRVYEAGVDAKHPFYLLTRDLLRRADLNQANGGNGRSVTLAVHDNPYKLMRSVGDSFKTGLRWLQDGMPNYRGVGDPNYRSASIHDALMTAMGDKWSHAAYQRFGVYLESRRAIEEWRAYEQKLADIERMSRDITGMKALSSDLRTERGKLAAGLETRQRQQTEMEALERAYFKELARLERHATSVEAAITNGFSVPEQRAKAQERLTALRRGIADYQGRLDGLAERLGRVDAERETVEKSIGGIDRALAGIGNRVEALRAERRQRKEKGAQTAPHRVGRAEHEARVAELEKSEPQFAQAAEQVYDFLWQQAVHDYQAGRLSKAELDYRETRKHFYVPFARDMSDMEEGGGGTPAAPKFAKDKAFKGSSRDVINPIEAIVDQTFHRGAATHFNEAMLAVARLTDIVGPGSAAIAERVTKQQILDADPDAFEKLQRAIVAEGYAEDDAAEMVKRIEADFGDTQLLLQWSPEGFGPKRPLLIPIWENGQRNFVRINDPELAKGVAEAVNSVGRELSNVIIDMIAKPAQLLRFGATQHPAFFGFNIIRDAIVAFALTGNILDPRTYPVVTQVRGLYHEFAQTDFARLYQETAGLMGGQNIAALDAVRFKRSVLELRERGLHLKPIPLAIGAGLGAVTGAALLAPAGLAVLGGVGAAAVGTAAGTFGGVLGAALSRGPAKFWETMAMVADLSETATRLGTASHVYAMALKNNPSLTPYQAAQEAGYVSRDLIDFGRRGSRMLVATKLVAFLNAQIQGLEKMIRVMAARSDRGYLIEPARGIAAPAAVGAAVGGLVAGPVGGAVGAFAGPAIVSNLAARMETVRELIAPMTKKLGGLQMSAEEEAALGDSAKMWVNLALYTAALLAFAAHYRDDEEYQGIDPALKQRSQPVKLFGDWYVIPKAFEMGLPSSIIEAAIDAQYGKDPRFWERVRSSMADTLVPPVVPQAVDLFRGLTANYDGFRGRPVVGEHMQKLQPDQQFNAYTSKLAVATAQSFNAAVRHLPDDMANRYQISPLMVDFAMRTTLGFWGKDFMKASNLRSDVGGRSGRLGEYPMIGTIVSRFQLDPYRRADAVNEYWQQMGQITAPFRRAAAGYDADIRRHGEEEANRHLATLTEEQRAYAIIEGQRNDSKKRYHPLNRLKAVMEVLGRVEAEIASEKLLDTTSPIEPEKIPVGGDKAALLRDVIGQIKAVEAHNAFVVLGHEQFKARPERDADGLYKVLRSIDAKVADEVRRRYGRAHRSKFEPLGIVDFADMKADWPALKKDLLTEWENAVRAANKIAGGRTRKAR